MIFTRLSGLRWGRPSLSVSWALTLLPVCVCVHRELKPCPPIIRRVDRPAGIPPPGHTTRNCCCTSTKINIRHPFFGTLCLQPKIHQWYFWRFSFFFKFFFVVLLFVVVFLSSRTLRINLPDVGGPGIVLLLSHFVSLENKTKQSKLTRTCKFWSF